MVFVGIDISKLSFDVAVLNNGSYKNNKFQNNHKGFKSFSKWLVPFDDELIICLEATGIYGLALAKFLYHDSRKVILINPMKTYSFAKMEMCRNKTDKADSQSIARYCKHLYDASKIDSNLFKPKSEACERLQYLLTRLEQLKKMRTQEINRLEISFDKEISKTIKSMIRHISLQIDKTEQNIKSLIKTDHQLKKQIALLVSIDAIGEKTAWAILAYLGDISVFNNAKQVSSYAGLNPKIQQSGTSINKSSLSKIGNRNLRKAMYMPAVVAITYNPLMSDLYSRLTKKGKPEKLAVYAVMRKLLVLAYGVLKSGKPFDPGYSLSSKC